MQETDISLLTAKQPPLASFAERFRDEILDVSDYRDDLTVVVRPEKIRDIIKFLKEDPSLQFNIMMDLFSMDYLKWEPPTPERYAIIYNLYSLPRHARIFVKVYLPESGASGRFDSRPL